jgi:hypothetical protein
MQEETYYSDGTNWVTNRRLVFGDAEYPLSDAINAELKADYPARVILSRVAVIATLVLLLGLVVFLGVRSGDPAYAQAIAAANIIAITGGLAVYGVKLRADYYMQISVRRALLNILSFMAMGAIFLVWFSISTKSLSLGPFCFVSLIIGLSMWRSLGRRGAFRIRMVERTRTVDVFSSGDRELVENLIGFIRLALVKRPNAAQANVQAPA